MLTAALLNIMHESASAIATYTDGMEEADFRASRLFRNEIEKHLLTLADSTSNIPDDIKAKLSEIDWDGWLALARILHGETQEGRTDATWYAMQSQAPATLLALRIYRRTQPELFIFTL